MSRGVIRAAQRGDANAVETLLREGWAPAYRTAHAMVGDRGVAEDIAQESLIAALRGLRQFDSRRPFEPWLHKIVVNRALDALRSRSARAEYSLDGAPAPEASAPVPAEISDGLMAALMRLDPHDRAIVVLRHIFGFSSSEIAGIVGGTAGGVRSSLSRTLVKLRGWLVEMESAPQMTAGGGE